MPAKAHIPQIEVNFYIDVDCILTVTSVDKGAGNKQSIKIEGAVALSPEEKQNLSRYYKQSENIYPLKKDLEKIRVEIEDLKLSCDKSIKDAEQSIKDFFELFHDKVEVNSQLYKVYPDQVREIQTMFMQKDQFIYGTTKYKDLFTSIITNVNRIEIKHLDFSDKEIVSKLQGRIDMLSNYRGELSPITKSIETNVMNIMANWIQILKSLEPNTEKMGSLEIANYHLTTGRVNKAIEILESIASGSEGLTEEAFYLLLKCYVRAGLREEYRDVHKRFGNLFGIIYPDFNRLNTFMNTANDSVFMIQGISQQQGAYSSGSGFCIAPNLIATNRHVIDGVVASNIKIIGKNKIHIVQEIELDPINDLAILRISDNLKPFRLGDFNFVEPGEQVLAIGFRSPSSNVHNENIYISKGIVNSIRNTDVSSERVIFVDAKIGSGMSGSPLINDLGEVVGIITLIRYQVGQSRNGIIAVEDQPVALPIHLVRKYLMKYMSK